MKSLKKFELEGSALRSDEMMNISGGRNVYFWVVTTKVANDRLKMCQQQVWNGSSYENYGPAYSTGETCIYDPSTGCN